MTDENSSLTNVNAPNGALDIAAPKLPNISFGLKDHNFNTSFEKNFFSMADPFIK